MPPLDSLADACLLPPFVGLSAPEWVLRRLAGGMRGVRLPGGARVVISAYGGGRVNALAVAELLLPQLVTT